MRGGRGVALASVLPLALMLLAHSAAAFPSSRLSYTRQAGAEHCPDEAAVRASVAARLGYDPFDENAERTIVARIVRNRNRLEAHVELVDAGGARHGRRELSSDIDDCDELVSSMALSISLAIDPERAQPVEHLTERAEASEPIVDERPRRRTKAVPRDTADALSDTPVPRESVRPADSASPVPYSGAGAHAAVGAAPGPAGGVFMFVGFEWTRFALALEGRIDAPGSAALASGGEISSSLFVASVLPCFHQAELFACASATAGIIRATSRDVSEPRTDTGAYGAAGGRLGLELPLIPSALWLRLHADAWLTLTRVEIELDGQRAWRAPPLSAASGVGLLARFP